MLRKKSGLSIAAAICLPAAFFLTYAGMPPAACAAQDLCLDKIKVYIMQGDYKSAITEGEKVMETCRYSPELDELYYLLGLSYLKEGNYLRASDIFEIILKEFKRSRFSEEAELGLGDAYFLMGEYDKAQDYYAALIKHYPQSKFVPQALYKISLCAAKSGRPEEAKQYLERLRREYPSSAEISLGQDLGGEKDFSYTVQVGAFSDPANAKNLMQELSAKGYPAYMQEDAPGEKVSYKVRVGRLRLRSEAAELQERLSRDGYPTKLLP